MSGVEIIFIVSVLILLGMWGWFIVLGFRTSRLWGAGLIFLFPISPFMFAYRFERRTRQAVYYLIGSIVFFMLMMFYIQFATSVDFYETLFHKIANAMPNMEFSSKPKPVKKLDLPPPAYIPPPRSEEPKVEPVIPMPSAVAEKKPGLPKQNYRRKEISVDSVGGYIGRTLLVSTNSGAKQLGRLISVNAVEIQVKINMSGGTAIVGIKKSKIDKIEVF